MACSELKRCTAKTTGCSGDLAELGEQLLRKRTVGRLEQEGGRPKRVRGRAMHR